MSKHAEPGPGCGQGRQWVPRLCRVEDASQVGQEGKPGGTVPRHLLLLSLV